MKIKDQIILVFCLSAFFSCRFIITKTYGINRKFRFKTRTEYIQYLTKKEKLDTSKIIYPDSISISIFLNDMTQRNSVEFYGAFLNDSLEIIKSDFLRENASCVGRIIKEVETINKNFLHLSDTSIKINHEFRNFKFKRVFGAYTNINDYKKPVKIFLIYSFAYGNLFDKFYKKMNELSLRYNNSLEIIIIDIDFPLYLKKIG